MSISSWVGTWERNTACMATSPNFCCCPNEPIIIKTSTSTALSMVSKATLSCRDYPAWSTVSPWNSTNTVTSTVNLQDGLTQFTISQDTATITAVLVSNPTCVYSVIKTSNSTFVSGDASVYSFSIGLLFFITGVPIM